MTTILDLSEPTTDRGLCVVCVERPRALPRLARCWACIRAEADRYRRHRESATGRSDTREAS
jgi:hypothetical protein